MVVVVAVCVQGERRGGGGLRGSNTYPSRTASRATVKLCSAAANVCFEASLQEGGAWFSESVAKGMSQEPVSKHILPDPRQ